MENTKTQTASDELEVIQMFRVDTRRGIDLKSVVVVRRVLKETIEGVEHLVREKEKKFSGMHVSIRNLQIAMIAP